MAINKKLIHFKTKQKFEEELANGNILDTSIVFIKDTYEIYTHGQLYHCSLPNLSEYVTDEELSELLNNYATLSAVNNKVDKVSGKGLSTNDYTTAEKDKLAGIASGAEVNVQSDWNETNTNSDAYIKNKPSIPTSLKNPHSLTVQKNGTTVATYDGSQAVTANITVPTVNDKTLTIQKNGTAVGTFTSNASADKTINITVSKSDVGLGNVDNTADANKSVKSATSAGYATSAGKVTNKLILPTGDSYDGSSEVTLTAADFGLSNALHFLGLTTTAIIDNSTTTSVVINNKTVTAGAGDVVLYNDNEYVFDGSKWHELGDGSSHALKTVTITAGNGLTGGGDLSANRTLNVGAGTGITVTADAVKAKLKSETASTFDSAAMGSTVNRLYAVGVDKSGYLSVNVPWTDTTYTSKAAASGGTDVSLVTTGEKASWNAKTSNTGTVTSVNLKSGTGITVSSSGTAITSSGERTISLNAAKADTLGGIKVGSVGTSASGANTTINANKFAVHVDSNGLGYVAIPTYTNNSGDITEVIAGNGLTGGATSGSATLHVGAGTGIAVTTDAVGIDSDYQTKIANGATAYGWGNHASAGYVKSSGVTSVTPGTGLTGTNNSDTAITGTGTVNLKTAATNEIGGIKVAKDNSSYTVATNTSSISANVTSGKYYGVEIDKNDKAFVYVPWTDTVPTWSTLSGKPTFLTGGSQTTTSSTDGGSNVYTFTKSDGTTSTLTVKNGSKGSKGDTGATGNPGNSVGSVVCVTANNGTTTGNASTADGGTSYYRVKDTAGNWLSGTIAVKNGSKGSKGDTGAAGASVTSATQTTSSTTSGGKNTVTFKNSAGTTIGSVDIYNGAKGDKGDKGDAGTNGTNGTNGTRGSQWYSGTAVTGTSTTGTIFSGSGISSALVNDWYLNTSTSNIYKCTTAGNASTAKWTYVSNIKGATGSNATVTAATGDSNGQIKINGTNITVKGLGSSAYATIYTKSAIESLAWGSHKGEVLGTECLAYWNGAYEGTDSNLTYCKNGTIIGSSNIGSQSVKYADLARGMAAGAYINTHPENNGAIIPFINNDLAFLLKKGGSAVVKFDNTVVEKDISNVFDGTASYWSGNNLSSLGYSSMTIELTLHKTFSWGATFYIDFGAVGFRAKTVKVEVINTNYANDVWTTKINVTNNGSGHVNGSVGHIPVGASNYGGGFNKIRITLSDWNSPADCRIAEIGVIAYDSGGLSETCLSRGGGSVYGNILPFKNNAYNLGSDTNRWANIYGGNFHGNATTATTATNLANAPTIATSTGTNQVTLAHGSKYALTVGGKSLVFTTPSFPTVDTAVSSGSTNLITSGGVYTGLTSVSINSVTARTSTTVKPGVLNKVSGTSVPCVFNFEKADTSTVAYEYIILFLTGNGNTPWVFSKASGVKWADETVFIAESVNNADSGGAMATFGANKKIQVSVLGGIAIACVVS